VGWFDDGSGLSASHPVGIFSTAGVLLGSETVTAADPLVASVFPQPGAGFRYHTLATPFGLAAGTYRIGGLNPAGSTDKNYDFVAGLTAQPEVGYVHSYYQPAGSLIYPNTLGDREMGYFGANFQFTPGGGPPPPPPPPPPGVDVYPAVSINLASDVQPGTAVGANIAGKVRSSSWNDIPLAQQTATPLKDNAGAIVAGLTLSTNETFAFPGSAYDSGAAFINVGDTAMMRGHLYHGAPTSVDIHIDGTIPFDKYDVYVYYNSGAVTNTQTISLLGSDLSDLGLSQTVFELPGTDVDFVEATNASINGNYVKFSGLSSATLPSFVLRAQSQNGYGYINGLQIVSTTPVPEPGSVALAACGGMAIVLAGLKKRRREVARPAC
jgi:hypothetical protein